MSTRGLIFTALSKMASVTCIISAAILASNKVEGWGWFLLVAVICFTTVTSNNAAKKEGGQA